MSKDERSSIYNILAFQFVGQDTADQTVKEIRASGMLEGFKIVAQVIVEQDAKGKVHVHETGKGGMGATVGAVGGGLLSLIGGPVGVLAWKSLAKECNPILLLSCCCWKTKKPKL